MLFENNRLLFQVLEVPEAILKIFCRFGSSKSTLISYKTYNNIYILILIRGFVERISKSSAQSSHGFIENQVKYQQRTSFEKLKTECQ